MNFEQAMSSYPAILGEGAVIERVRRDLPVDLDPYIANSGLIYDPAARDILESMYRGYLDIGLHHDLPMIVLAPTWRANPERILKSSYSGHKTINQDCVRFIRDLRGSYDGYARKIFIGGLMACKGDAYNPAEALSEKAAEVFHRTQAEILAVSGVDFMMVSTLPALGESVGMGRVLAATGIPYVLSFVIRPEGTLLDGTPLEEAVSKIDDATQTAPLFYSVNCVHPSIFQEGVGRAARNSKELKRRILGLQANTSALSPEELDGRDNLDTTAPEPFADLMLELHTDYGLKVLGGCCGSDQRHISEIARRLNQSG